MLNKEDAIDSSTYYDNRGKNCGRLYHFACAGDCDSIIKVRSSGLKRHSGFCFICSKRRKRFWGVYNSLLRGSAKRRGVDCDLTYEEFLFLTQIRDCCYCGCEVTWEPFTGHGVSRYNLDRRDASRGYSLDNVVVCCAECNRMKSNTCNADEFRAMRLFLSRWREGTDLERQELMYMLVSWRDRLEILQ